jgi:glycogen operon protein
LLRFRADHPAFRQSEFFHGDHIDDNNLKDVVWLSPDGSEMTDADWIVPEKRCLGVRYAAALGAPNDAGPALLLLNAADTQVRFVLPAAEPDQSWCCLIDTFHEAVQPEARLPQSAEFLLEGRSLALFVSERTA